MFAHATGLQQVKEFNDETELISREEKHERVSRDRVALAPSSVDIRDVNSLKGALKGRCTRRRDRRRGSSE